MRILLGLAQARGLTVTWSPELGEFVRGLYEHDRQTITLTSGMTSAQARTALAHEIGHAWYGHRWTGNAHHDADAERLADEYAARLLIDDVDYAAAERLVGPHPGAIARELEVTAAVVRVWQHVRLKSAG